MLGKAYLDLRYKEILLARLYRQDLNLPYLNRHDSRMIPNTFEAYVLRSGAPHFDFIARHVTQMKKRDSRDFVSMSEAAGTGLLALGTVAVPFAIRRVVTGMKERIVRACADLRSTGTSLSAS